MEKVGSLSCISHFAEERLMILNQRLPEETKTKVPCCRISLNVSPGAVLP